MATIEQSDRVSDKGRRVTIDLSPAATCEVDRLRQVTGLTTADIFRSAMTVFRIYVDAHEQGKEVRVIDPSDLQTQTRIVLPISVSPIPRR
jgi:hypothetical protein